MALLPSGTLGVAVCTQANPQGTIVRLKHSSASALVPREPPICQPGSEHCICSQRVACQMLLQRGLQAQIHLLIALHIKGREQARYEYSCLLYGVGVQHPRCTLSTAAWSGEGLWFCGRLLVANCGTRQVVSACRLCDECLACNAKVCFWQAAGMPHTEVHQCYLLTGLHAQKAVAECFRVDQFLAT